MKQLKLFNGRFARGDHACIAAYSRAEASRLSGLSDSELKNYFHECWGTSAKLALGYPTEPCFWVYRTKERYYERLDKKEPIIHDGGCRGSGVTYTKFDDIPKFTQDGSWECDFPLHHVWKFIKEQQDNEGLDINPDFQRAHVWTEAQQIAWIEFFLRGGKTGRVFYLNKPSWNQRRRAAGYDDFVLVDGKQRLEAIRRFIDNEIRVFGSYYREFTDSLRMNQTVKVNINDLKTKRDVLSWYVEMNAGGTPHSAEEINRVRALMGQE